MATLGSTLVTGDALGLPVPIGGVHIEIWRVAGGTVGDTATVTPNRGRFVVAAVGGPVASTTLSTLGVNTTVVFTLTASSATDVTFDTTLYIQD